MRRGRARRQPAESTELGQSLEICVPDIGDFDEVEVVELLVAKGDVVEFDDPLISVESDKATMEIPSSAAGVVAELLVSEGDRVSEGSVLLVLDVTEGAEASSESEPEREEAIPAAESVPAVSKDALSEEAPPESRPAVSAPAKRELSAAARHPFPDREGLTHASPLARRYARELGVPIESAAGSGAHGRVLVDDLNREVRERFAGDAPERTSSSGGAIPPIPAVDHAAFGPVHDQPLTRIQKLSGPALHRSWLNVPHVTQYDETDITELERFRRDRRELASERGLKLSPLLFVMKAVAVVLDEFPAFRSSLSPEADRLIVKDYIHLGIAVDTDQGLVVPVIRDVDRKGVFELAAELNEAAERARARKLTPDDLKGACFTISSLGGIGGTAFSPIVNAPEVAILGLSKTRVQPVWKGPSPIDLDGGGIAQEAQTEADATAGRFEPRLVLPFSLSYDHRVIDGANAVRFTSRLSRVLSDPLQLLL
jgi:pyruvate dehydrogenase E2 component (dihydrolipoamide acetyltransferase)